jgi:carbon storage regulator CsrA
MLVLGRQPGQAIHLDTLNGEIVVSILKRTKRDIKIGIDAPKDVPISRRDMPCRAANSSATRPGATTHGQEPTENSVTKSVRNADNP